MIKALAYSFKMLRIEGLREILQTHLGENVSLERALPLTQKNPDLHIGWGRKKSGRNAQTKAEKTGKPYLLLEDGFLRSLHTPQHSKHPLSLVIDDIGIYYDARQPSRLENVLSSDKKFSAEEITRAENAMAYLCEHKLSKYNHAPLTTDIDLPKNYILLIDQTYGDLSIAGAMADKTDFESMLSAALETNAPIVIKTHPQVISAKKKGYLYSIYSALPQSQRKRITLISENINPYTLIAGAKVVFTVSSGMGFEALIAGKPVHCFGLPFYAGWGITEDEKIISRRTKKRSSAEIFAAFYFDYSLYFNPLSRQATNFEDIASLIKLQRDHHLAHNKPIAALHISRWKRPAIDAFLSTLTSKPTYFMDEVRAIDFALKNGANIYVWSSRMSEKFEENCANKNIKLMRIEDGFIRSRGLGAKLTLPCSLCFDDIGIYYDARTPSSLEKILNTSDIDETMQNRARNLINTIVDGGLSKYNLKTAQASLEFDTNKKIILVPGQVEDDASVRFGGDTITSNLDLIKAVRAKNLDAFIIYKPHPDVMAGLREGHTARNDALSFADKIEEGGDIIALINAADEVHVNTSLTGFEALLRGKTVHCYGIPFFAGWGLTHDHINYPHRTRSRTLEELVAGALILYPSYIHPRAMTPCRAEDIVQYLMEQKDNPPTKRSLASHIYSAYGSGKKFIGGHAA